MLEIHPSARKHGIVDEDIDHALTDAMAIDDTEDDARLSRADWAATRRADRGGHDSMRRGDESLSTRCRCARSTDTCSRALMAPKKKTHGTTRSGHPIDDDLVEELAAKAERGYDVDVIVRRRGGGPPIGSGPATVESVRLDLELRRALAERAEQDQESTSSVIRKALRSYLSAR